MKRKVALVDLDNVVYPWTEVMAIVIASNTEVGQTPQDLMQLYKSWSVEEDWGIPEGVFNWWWERAIEEGIMWGATPGKFCAAPIPGATLGLWALSDAEWHIHLVTTRLNKFRLHDKAVKNTVDWLAYRGIPYRSLTFTADKHQIMGDAIIDDRPENLIGHPAPVKILYPAPHNRSFREQGAAPGIHILEDDPSLLPWNEIVDILGDGRKE